MGIGCFQELLSAETGEKERGLDRVGGRTGGGETGDSCYERYRPVD